MLAHEEERKLRDIVGPLRKRGHAELSPLELREQPRVKTALCGQRPRRGGDDAHVGVAAVAPLARGLGGFEDRRQTLLHLFRQPLHLLEVQGSTGRQIEQAQARSDIRQYAIGSGRGRGLRPRLQNATLSGRQQRAVDVDECLAASRRGVVDAAGRCFVTRAGGPRQQHRLGVRGAAADRFAQRADRGAIAEQRAVDPSPRVGQHFLRDFQLACELRVSVLHLAAEALQREVGTDARQQLAAVERLAHIIDRAHVEAAHDIGRVDPRGAGK